MRFAKKFKKHELLSFYTFHLITHRNSTIEPTSLYDFVCTYQNCYRKSVYVCPHVQ